MLTPRRLVLPVIVAVAAILSLAQVNQHLILASDNSSYVVLGQALAQGRGYVMVNEPLAPAMSLYPPGYPLLLALVLQAAGAVADPLRAVAPLKLVAVFFHLASLPVLYALARRRRGLLVAGAATLLFAVNPGMLTLATEILSETPFILLALLGLLILDWSVETPDGSRRWWGLLAAAALCLAAAYYMRTAGLAMLAAAPLFLILRRRRRGGLALGAALTALALPWFLRSSAPPTPETPFFARSYIHQVLALAPYSEQNATLGDLIGRVFANSWTYAVRILPETMLPHLERLGPLAGAAALLVAALVVLGFVLELRRGLHASELAVAAYWLSLSLFVWVLGFRYVAVILPFAFLYLLVGVQWCAQRLADGVRRWRTALPALAVGLAACVLLVSALAVDVRRAERNVRVTRQQTLAESYAGDREWTAYLRAAEWLKAYVAPDAVIMSRKPDLLYLLTRRPTVEYPYTQDTAVLQRVVRANHAGYILEDAFTWTRTTETYLAPAMRGAAESFVLEYETPAPQTRVWRVR